MRPHCRANLLTCDNDALHRGYVHASSWDYAIEALEAWQRDEDIGVYDVDGDVIIEISVLTTGWASIKYTGSANDRTYTYEHEHPANLLVPWSEAAVDVGEDELAAALASIRKEVRGEGP